MIFQIFSGFAGISKCSIFKALQIAFITAGGAPIAPASPAFYNKPKTLDDNINFIVGRVLDLLGYDSAIFSRWEGSE